MNLFDFLEPLMLKINEALELVQIAIDEDDTKEAKKLMDDVKALNSAKQNLLSAINAKFGERLLTHETRKILESLGLPPKEKVDLEKEMKMFGPKERVHKEKTLEQIPILKSPVPYAPEKPSEDIDEAPIDLTSSKNIDMLKIAEDKGELKLLLYFLRALSQIYQYMHWRSAGTNYYGDHLLYERLYNETSDEIDQVAEKTIGITDDSTSISPTEDVKYTSHIVNKFVRGEFKTEGFAEIAIAAEKEMINLIAKLMHKGQSDGVENMIQGIADKHEGHLYLLQQRNKTAAIMAEAMVKLANHLDSLGEFEIADQIDDVVASIVVEDNSFTILDKMSKILEQIERIETRGALTEEDHNILSILREKYKELAAKLDTLLDEEWRTHEKSSGHVV